MDMNSLRPALRGALTGGAMVLVVTVCIAADTALKYDGECGGLIPFTGGTHECSFAEYMRVSLPFTLKVFFIGYWYLSAAVLVLPAAIFHILHGLNSSR